MIVVKADQVQNASDLNGRADELLLQKKDGDRRLGEITHPSAGEE